MKEKFENFLKNLAKKFKNKLFKQSPSVCAYSGIVQSDGPIVFRICGSCPIVNSTLDDPLGSGKTKGMFVRNK